MKLVDNDFYENTGGGAMVMYVDVLAGGEINQLLATDEVIVFYDKNTEDDYIYKTDSYVELVEYVGDEFAKQLHKTFLKYAPYATWFPIENE